MEPLDNLSFGGTEKGLEYLHGKSHDLIGLPRMMKSIQPKELRGAVDF